MTIFLYILVGLIAGVVGAATGTGGGAVMVPLFVFLFGLTQHQAQGTALTVMLVPVMLFAVLQYYQAGNVNLKIALFVAIGFALGAFLSGHFVQNVPSSVLKKVFGCFLIIIGIKMAFLK